MTLLKRFKSDTKFALIFVTALISIVALIIFLYIHFTKRACKDIALCLIAPLLKKLAKKGFIKQDGESILSLLNRYSSNLEDKSQIELINKLYHRCRYANDNEACRELKKVVKEY